MASVDLGSTYYYRGGSFHALIPIAWLADGNSLMCYIVTMGSQIAEMFSIFSL